jgi:von Willebrand factor type A domain
MKGSIVRARRILLVVAFVVAAAGIAAADERIQLAILLDTSNSMDGLIGQAKSTLWNVVNELARSRRNGRIPVLEVALFEYGNDGLEESGGYIRMVSDLTTDLDRISEELFKLSTNGGSEYCGMVIDRAVGRLSWSRSNDVLKVIYIAGNEPFTQGPVSYATSAAKAARKGIIVNTVFCGDRQEGIETFWKDGADRADGRYMNINTDEAVVQIDTPFDADIVKLGDTLNKTYIGYGSAGKTLKERQAAQDSNAASMGQGATVQRSVAKAQAVYSNEGWDLVDAIRDKTVTLQDLKEDQLPAEMRTMSPAQREDYVRGMAAQRAEIQKKINAVNEKRRLYVAEEIKKRAGSNTLEQAILSSVTAQAEAKGFKVK